jgi:hypothetical protein
VEDLVRPFFNKRSLGFFLFWSSPPLFPFRPAMKVRSEHFEVVICSVGGDWGVHGTANFWSSSLMSLAGVPTIDAGGQQL